MTATIIHIADFKGTKRLKFCDGTPLTPPAADDKTPKMLCEHCRQEALKRRK